MTKYALLIGVSEYGEGIPSLSAPPNDVAAMERVLKNPEMAGFDEVIPLVNPNSSSMRIEISKLFKKAKKGDLVLFYFSGHGLTDEDEHLYLSCTETTKEYFQATSVAAKFIQDQSRDSYCKRQVLILDCCYSGAFKDGWQPRNIGLELEKELGGEGRVVLTASSATQKAFEQEGDTLAVYTKYLVEGIETGAADKDGDGKIFVDELHKYASEKVKEAKPKMKPQIIHDQEGFQIFFSKAPKNDPTLEFRKLVEKYIYNGKINPVGKRILEKKRIESGLGEEEARRIIAEVLEPYRQHQKNREEYREAVEEILQGEDRLDDSILEALDDLQDLLGLEDGDVIQARQKVVARLSHAAQEARETYQKNLDQYRTAFQQAVGDKYPLNEFVRSTLDNQWRSWQLEESDIKGIEKPILEDAEAEYQSQLQAAEDERKQREAEAERKRLEVIGERERRKQEEANRRAKNEQPKSFVEDLGNGVKLKMIFIPKGSFLMGSPDSDSDASDSENPQHRVEITQSFYLGECQITQGQWQAVMGNNPSGFGTNWFANRDTHPVETVSWDDCQKFLTKLNQQTGKKYRLPTEVEWEYACRAGTQTRYYFGDNADQLGEYAWFDGNSGSKTHPVMTKKPNQFGLNDMYGNVWEWCEDDWENNYNTPRNQKPFVNSSKRKVLRGGSWKFNPWFCRSANRFNFSRSFQHNLIGFRVVCSLPG